MLERVILSRAIDRVEKKEKKRQQKIYDKEDNGNSEAVEWMARRLFSEDIGK